MPVRSNILNQNQAVVKSVDKTKDAVMTLPVDSDHLKLIPKHAKLGCNIKPVNVTPSF
jgi:hypothetical protein